MGLLKTLVETEIGKYKAFLKKNMNSFQKKMKTEDSEELRLKIRDCLTGIMVLGNLMQRLEPTWREF